MATVEFPALDRTSPRAPSPQSRRLAHAAAFLLWIVPMLVIAALVVHAPLKHTVTMGSYHPSAENWWKRQSLYVGPSGMNYLPHFAILYTPFNLLPLALSEVLWRFCAAASLAGGLWLLARELFGAESERPFLWATILAMPLSLGALRNGNANAIFGGVTLLAIVATLQKRWWLAVGWMVLATALKPLGIVLLLLTSIYYAPVARRLPAVVIALVIFPFFFGSPQYVLSQYREAWHNLGACAVVTDNRFADLNGLLRTFGAPLSPRTSTIVRVLAGGITALAWLWGASRLQPAVRCLWLYALATAYLMLFNPMTETNSYVILAPALAAWGAYFLFSDQPPRRPLGWACVFIALSMPVLPNILRPFFGNYFALFWHPAMTLVFLAMLLVFVSSAKTEKLQPST
ncbi:MAG TPA: glycosyltransferase family 87 protein [Verrucomicrobiae bacterium]|nr:glycosyltransferase family 87 protein [Verrucomicrobiae bacterium]